MVVSGRKMFSFCSGKYEKDGRLRCGNLHNYAVITEKPKVKRYPAHWPELGAFVVILSLNSRRI